HSFPTRRSSDLKDCNSGPHQWVYPDAPLVPDTTEPGWWGYSPKTGTQIRERVSSSRLSGSVESESWDYSPKAEKPSRSDGDDRRATRHRSRKRRRKRATCGCGRRRSIQLNCGRGEADNEPQI